MRKAYKSKEIEIKSRLKEFKENYKDKNKILRELCFCLCTPQSKAELCWKAVCALPDRKLKGVRFANNKIKYIDEANKNFTNILNNIDAKNPEKTREWLVENVKGLGMKEASHFLRNIGLGENFAILDRHILKNLKKEGVIKEIPKTLSKKKYLEIEKQMRSFAKKIKIPMDELDLLFWSMETGKVFK